MRQYELTFIASPHIPETDFNTLLDQIQGYIKQAGIEIEKFEKLGRRRLAYEIKHEREGFYVMATLRAKGGEIAEVERRLRVSDAILRYLTVRVDEDYQRAERMAAERNQRIAKRAAASGAHATAQSELPASGAGEERE
ncbi:MAG: 30S ribosomal protein S6 [Acidobacteria bacterium]|nr:30S ribosomal protein S6 [Acidobacteriota bacterium]